MARARSSKLMWDALGWEPLWKYQYRRTYVGRNPVPLTNLTVIGTAIISTDTFINDGRDIYLIDTPGFDDTNKPDTEILQAISSLLAQSYTSTHKLAGIVYLHRITGGRMENSRISSSEVGNPDDGRGRTEVHFTPEKWHQGLVSVHNIESSFGIHFRCSMSCDWATDPNHEETDLRNDRMRRHFRCPDEDDMNSVSSGDQESLFGSSPSVSNTATTVGSSVVQNELTHTNIEHMLAVLKAERGKCLGELRGLDAALEIIDQLANGKRL